LKKISHSSALGFANEPASLLAAEIGRGRSHYGLRITIYEGTAELAAFS
jgi:hypothetical protein